MQSNKSRYGAEDPRWNNSDYVEFVSDCILSNISGIYFMENETSTILGNWNLTFNDAYILVDKFT